MSKDEHFGIRAELNKDKPKNVAGLLRSVADALENAPNNRRYDVDIQTVEYVLEDSFENEDESEGRDAQRDIQELNYNVLKSIAAENGLNVGMNPTKDRLVSEIEAGVDL